MNRARRLMVVFALALAVWLPTADFAAAQTTPTASVTGTLSQGGRSCSNYVGLSNRIVMCMRDTLDHATSTYFTGFYRLVERMIVGFLTLSVIIYGILAMYGMLEKPGRDVMILMVKLSFITFFVSHADIMYSRLITAMDAAAAAVVDFTPVTGAATSQTDLSRIECLKNMKEAANQRMEKSDGSGTQPNYSAAWLGIDCTVDSVIGIRIPTTVNGTTATQGLQSLTLNRQLGQQPGMARGLIGFFFSSMQSSILGILVAIVGFVFLYTLIWIVMKALFVYLAGYIGIAFMMIFAPLFIPLVLFRVTKEYFDKWVKLTIAFALQPILILAFITFSIAAIDLAMFSGDYSVMYRIAGDASRQQGFNLNAYLDTQNHIVLRQPAVLANVKTGTATPDLNQAIDGVLPGLRTSDCAKALADGNVVAKDGTQQNLRQLCSQTYPVQWWHNSIDWKKMASVRTPAVTDPGVEQGDTPNMSAEDRKGRQIAREVFAAVLFAAIVVLVINGLMGIIPAIVNDLAGDSFQSPNLFNQISRRPGSPSVFTGGLNRVLGGGRR